MAGNRPLRADQEPAATNVGPLERAVSVIGGGFLVAGGFRKRGTAGAAAVLLGGAALKRGLTGWCNVYGALDLDTSGPEEAAPARPSAPVRRAGVDVSAAATVDRPADELYRLWRDPSNLPRFVSVIEGVDPIDERRARWRLHAPFGREVEFEAEITADEPGTRIAWRAAPGSLVEHVGEVRFRSGPPGRGTEVHMRLRFLPPGGAAGASVAALFDGAAEMKLRGDLKRFKQMVETGEVATTDGQPSGRA
jgi:uncharacterized membrane protein